MGKSSPNERVLIDRRWLEALLTVIQKEGVLPYFKSFVSTLGFLLLTFCLLKRVSLCSPGWCGTCYVDQAGPFLPPVYLD